MRASYMRACPLLLVFLVPLCEACSEVNGADRDMVYGGMKTPVAHPMDWPEIAATLPKSVRAALTERKVPLTRKEAVVRALPRVVDGPEWYPECADRDEIVEEYVKHVCKSMLSQGRKIRFVLDDWAMCPDGSFLLGDQRTGKPTIFDARGEHVITSPITRIVARLYACDVVGLGGGKSMEKLVADLDKARLSELRQSELVKGILGPSGVDDVGICIVLSWERCRSEVTAR